MNLMKRVSSKTVPGYTWTSEGYVPYMKYGTLELPVMLDFSKKGESPIDIPPMRNALGQLLYATPWGQLISNGTER